MADHQSLVVRLLNTPDIAAIVPQLPPQVLHRVIEHCGLEACAEIVALATPAQIERVLDVDLWHASTPGRDEVFDASRFGDWLDVIMQSGEAVALAKLTAIDSDLIVAGFSHHVSVFDMVSITPYTTLDGEEVGGRRFDRADTAEIGGFMVEARRAEMWDTVVEALGTLNVERPDYFQRLMRACIALSSGTREEDASHNLLEDRAQDMFDLASVRETRRDAQGYVTPADARAFLQSARELHVGRTQPPPDPLALGYFRTLAAWDADEAEATASTDDRGPAPSAGDALPDAAAVEAVMGVLHDEGVIVHPRALLTAGEGGAPRLALVGGYLESHASAAGELAYLTNVLLAGGTIQGRAVTTQEAPELAAATCNLGLERWPKAWPDVSLVTAFQIGWNALYLHVCLHAAKALVDALRTIRHEDRETQLLLNQLRRELIRHGKAGAPWRARDLLDAIMMLDTASWAVLLGLIDETPVLHAAAWPGPHGRTIVPTDFEFIAGANAIQAADTFIAGLPANLTR